VCQQVHALAVCLSAGNNVYRVRQIFIPGLVNHRIYIDVIVVLHDDKNENSEKILSMLLILL